MADSNLYELTNPQKNIWYTEQFYKGSNIHNICGTAIINEVVNFDLLKEALLIFAQKNDVFRYKLKMQDNNVKQYISNEVNKRKNSFKTISIN